MQTPIKENPMSSSDPSELEDEIEYRRVYRSQHPEGSVVRFGSTPFGDGGFTVIAGPCAVESAQQIDETARIVAEHGGRVLRGGAFKPRTSPYSFQGLGLEGVEMMRRAADNHGLPLVTEVMAPGDVEEMAELVDAFQIGARNMQNFDLLCAIGQSGVPAMLKRGFGTTLREWLLAAEYILAEGNDQVILCERGIRTFDEATRFTLDLAGALWAQRETHLPVIIDPSHATGEPGLIPSLVQAAVAAGLDGAMVEVHPEPASARSDGDQALEPEQFAELMERLEHLAGAIGRPLV